MVGNMHHHARCDETLPYIEWSLWCQARHDQNVPIHVMGCDMLCILYVALPNPPLMKLVMQCSKTLLMKCTSLPTWINLLENKMTSNTSVNHISLGRISLILYQEIYNFIFIVKIFARKLSHYLRVLDTWENIFLFLVGKLISYAQWESLHWIVMLLSSNP